MACLIVTDGPDQGRLIPVGRGVLVLGREESLKVQLTDAHASRRHFRISYVEDTRRHLLEDLESRNGTRLNHRQIVGPTPLKPGDRVGVGDSVLVYLDEDHPDAASALAEAKRLGEREIPTLGD